MKQIILHGSLADMVGQNEFTVDVVDARGAFSWLFAMFPKAKTLFKDSEWNIFYSSDDPDTNDDWLSIDESELALQTSRSEIHIAPAVCGLGGNRGVVKTVIGVIIIVVATYFSAGSLTPGTVAAVFGAEGAVGSLAFAGLALTLSGIAQMLTPIPDMSSLSQQERNQADKRPSYLFNGAVNVLEEGGAVPLIYGRHRMGSTVISSGVQIEQIAVTVPETTSAPPPTVGTSGGTATTSVGVFDSWQEQIDNAP